MAFVPYGIVCFWCPKIMMSATKMAKHSQTNPLFTTECPPTPFFHRMEAYARVDPSDSVEEMARGMLVASNLKLGNLNTEQTERK